MTDAVLSTQDLSRRFGGLMAASSVTIELQRGRLHAVLGPNGAGKTTLINLLSGDLAATAGTIRYKGQDITGYSAHRRSRIGIGRSYQKTNIFLPFTALENVRLAAQSRRPHAARWLTRAKSIAATNEAAMKALEWAGLRDRRTLVAGALSHGEQRQLEIAMSLATEPKVLLLDEPLAGMGVAEAERMVQLLVELKRHHAMMLVEHDMDAVFALADQLTVMVNGQVIASGAPADVRADPTVQSAYLGEED